MIASQRITTKAFQETLYELYGYDYSFYADELEKIDLVTADGILKVARKYLEKNRFMVHVLLGEE